MPGWILASGGNEFSDIYAEADLAALSYQDEICSFFFPLLLLFIISFKAL